MPPSEEAPDAVPPPVASTSGAPPAGNLRRRAAGALFWSLIQTWGSRLLSMLAFLVLARFLSPEQFGLASAAILVFSVVALASELGVGDTLIRNRDLTDTALNTFFFAAVGLALVLAVASALSARELEARLGVAGLAPFVVCTAALVPLSVAAGFQEAVLKRDMQFRRLAMRSLLAGGLSGCVGIGLALNGFGAWAIIGVFATQIVVGAAWLFWRAAWLPGLSIDLGSFRLVGAFGLNIMGMRVVDFSTMRAVDVLVLTHLGPASFGLFSLSWRLYQFLMQLLQAALGGVGLVMLSQIHHDRSRLGRVFVRALSISAIAAAPPFFLVASLASEVTHLLLGPHWVGAEAIMAAFLVVGAVHCVIFSSGSFLTAVGRPQVLLRLMFLKAVFVLVPLLLLRSDDPSLMAMFIAASLVAEAPFTIHATLRALDLSWSDLVRPVLAPLAAGALAAVGVAAFRGSGFAPTEGSAAMLLIGGLVYTAIYASLVLMTSFGVARTNAAYILGAMGRS